MPKPKRVNKSKEEIKLEMQGIKNAKEVVENLKRNPKFIEKLKFTKEVFYPVLVASGDTVNDTMLSLSQLSNLLMSKAMESIKEKKFSELGIIESLDPKLDRYAEKVKWLEIFKDLKVFEARDAIDGMKSELQTFIDDEMKHKPLGDLKTKWIDEL